MRTTLIVLSFILAGCSIARQAGEDYCEESKLNTESIKSTAECILRDWPVCHGLIVGSMGPRIDELPQHMRDAMNQLDELSQKYYAGELTDYELGLALGLKLRLLMNTIAETLRIYAPDVLIYLTPFL